MRYVDADWIIQKLERWRSQLAETYGENDEYVLCLGEVLMKLDDAPTADVRENVKAHWIDMKPTGDSRFMCSRCKGKEKVPTIMGEPIVLDYCPNCGADMRGDKP